MKRILLVALATALVLGTGISRDALAGHSVSNADYMQGHGPMSAAQRGHYARDFVNKWGPYYRNVYRQPVAEWAKKEALIIATADSDNLRRAMRNTTLEAAMMALRGQQTSDDDAVDFLARQPAGKVGNLPRALGHLSKDLVYTPLEPCRIFDTRSIAPVLSGSTRSFDVYPYSSYTGFEYQGGKANTNCGMIPDAAAVAINIATPLPEVGGYLTVYPHDTSRPFASNLDYDKNEFKNNEIVAKVGTGSYDINVYAHGKTHVVADVVGYYAAPAATALECIVVKVDVQITHNGQSGWAYCPSNYTITGGAASYNLSPAPGTFSTRFSNNSFQASSTSALSSSPQSLAIEARCCRVPGR